MNDWIEWTGGECPVESGVAIGIKMRDGSQCIDSDADAWTWHRNVDSTGLEVEHDGDIVAYRILSRGPAQSEQPNPKPKPNKYSRQVNGASIDVYDVLMAWNVTNPAVQHAIKKLLQPGNRGHKDKLTDLSEARDSIIRAIELESK